ncbi:MAG: hypothetical protein EAX96_16140 [Candidatus Lokiarchaeota archaeon]|nr:hypothetical protein [Candidatus Lokiarchaeota archaeon]
MPYEFGDNWIQIIDYYFFPASVYPNKKIMVYEIEEINLLAAPPEIKIKNELIFISAKFKDELEKFALKNNIKVEKRFDIWDSILEVFLDTEISENAKIKTFEELKQFGLDEETVKKWRERVKNPMIGYNFGTMLWDWVHLGQWDMLQAHLLFLKKFGKEKFEKLYWDSMKIALLAYP